MTKVMNRYLQLISCRPMFYAPANEGNNGGNGNGGGDDDGNGDDDDDSGAGDDEGAGDEDEEVDEDNLGIKELFADNSKKKKAVLDDIDLGDDDSKDDEPDPAYIEAGKALGAGIRDKIANIKFTAADLPKDFDVTNPDHMNELMSTVGRRAAQESVSQIPAILNHALTMVVSKMEKKIASAVGKTQVQSEAQKAFAGLGITDPADKEFAKTIFTQGVKRGLSADKAAAAVRNTLKAMGKNVKANSGNGNRQGGGQSGNTIKTGADALAGMFGD